MEPVTPSKRPVEGADEPTNVVRPVGDDTGMIRGDYELIRGTRLGEYEIEEPLGGGGMGEVFSAVHPKIGKRAAIKVLKKELSNTFNVERFIDEAKVVNTIGHPNIVDIFAFGEMPDGRCYFVMELLVGETLRERIARGRLPVEEACALLRPLCRALEAAHAKGVIHRDLKPDNIFLVDVPGERPTVKLLDFGIAKLAKADHRIEQTKSGVMVGTPQYIAPEQAKGREIDARADIYSLGGIVFEMLTGRPPYEADNAMEMVAKHLMEAVPRPSSVAPGIPPELDSLIMAMLAKEPAQRPGLSDVALIIDRLKAGSINLDDRDTLEATPRREARQPTPVPAPYTPPPMTASVELDNDPLSGAHTAVEDVVSPLPTLASMPVQGIHTDGVQIGKGRGVWIAGSIIVLGIAMILSFVLIKVLRGGTSSTPDAAAVAIVDAAVVASEPDASLPDAAAAIADATIVVVEPDAAVAPPDAAVMRPDAGVARPPPPPVRGRLILDVGDAGRTIDVLANGKRVGRSRHVEIDLPINTDVEIEVRSDDRKTKRFTVKATPGRPTVRMAVKLVLDGIMEPGQH